MSLRSAVLSAYRRLLTAQRRSFAGDHEMLSVSRAETRGHFRAKAGLTSAAEIEQAVADAHDATEFITKELLQLQFAPQTQRYVANIRPEHLIHDPPAAAEPAAAAGAGAGASAPKAAKKL